MVEYWNEEKKCQIFQVYRDFDILEFHNSPLSPHVFEHANNSMRVAISRVQHTKIIFAERLKRSWPVVGAGFFFFLLWFSEKTISRPRMSSNAMTGGNGWRKRNRRKLLENKAVFSANIEFHKICPRVARQNWTRFSVCFSPGVIDDNFHRLWVSTAVSLWGEKKFTRCAKRGERLSQRENNSLGR